ncbi:hypothetical protein [Parasediminibacterium sp. JCM 36343]|uniref:hypothetical protein n=1 Tax=Parasediminibacterium sp. JCM 36343 TaxID=3374279 RepID=UPI00397B75FA
MRLIAEGLGNQGGCPNRDKEATYCKIGNNLRAIKKNNPIWGHISPMSIPKFPHGGGILGLIKDGTFLYKVQGLGIAMKYFLVFVYPFVLHLC